MARAACSRRSPRSRGSARSGGALLLLLRGAPRHGPKLRDQKVPQLWEQVLHRDARLKLLGQLQEWDNNTCK